MFSSKEAAYARNNNVYILQMTRETLGTPTISKYSYPQKLIISSFSNLTWPNWEEALFFIQI
jgi:hypothetical protein